MLFSCLTGTPQVVRETSYSHVVREPTSAPCLFFRVRTDKMAGDCKQNDQWKNERIHNLLNKDRNRYLRLCYLDFEARCRQHVNFPNSTSLFSSPPATQVNCHRALTPHCRISYPHISNIKYQQCFQRHASQLRQRVTARSERYSDTNAAALCLIPAWPSNDGSLLPSKRLFEMS